MEPGRHLDNSDIPDLYCGTEYNSLEGHTYLDMK